MIRNPKNSNIVDILDQLESLCLKCDGILMCARECTYLHNFTVKIRHEIDQIKQALESIF